MAQATLLLNRCKSFKGTLPVCIFYAKHEKIQKETLFPSLFRFYSILNCFIYIINQVS